MSRQLLPLAGLRRPKVPRSPDTLDNSAIRQPQGFQRGRIRSIPFTASAPGDTIVDGVPTSTVPRSISPIQGSSGSSLVTTLVAGTVGIILLILAVQATTAIIEWVQLNALANRTAILAASNLSQGVTVAVDSAQNSLTSSGLLGSHDSDIHWSINGQTVTLTLQRSIPLLTGSTALSARATALVN